MLRTTSLVKTIPNLRPPTIFGSFKNYTTSTTTPATNENKSLSARLGGSGRGKVMDAAADPFASFLANAKKPRNNNRNGSFTPRPRRQQQQQQQQQQEGQFSDAGVKTEGGEKKKFNNNNNRQPRKTDTEGVSATTEGENNKKRQPRFNNNNNRNNNRDQQQQRPNRRLNLNRSNQQQPQEIRTRRATTFIDKDIDWSSFDTVASVEQEAVKHVETAEDNNELLLKDIAGDYDRYLSVGQEINWSDMMKRSNNGVTTLVASNPTFDLAQKSAFLAAVSSATVARK
jgi:hypothetical protein